MDYNEREIEEIKEDIKTIQARQQQYIGLHHGCEKELVLLKSEIKHVKTRMDVFSANVSKILWIVLGGFAAAIVSFIVQGGLIG